MPKILQNRPFHLKPATDLGPTKTGKNQNLEPFLSHINVFRNKHNEIAPGSTAKGVAVCCVGVNVGGGAVGACCGLNVGNPPGGLGGVEGNCGPKNRSYG